MGVCDYVINIVAAFIAIEYMDHGFEKRYSCIKHRILFAMGCGVYFFVVTQINYRTNYEGILCLLYGGIVTLYGVLALKGSIHDKVFLGFLWILIVLFGTFIIYGIVGIVTEKNIKTLLELEGDILFIAAVMATIVKFCMGRMVLRLYKKKNRPYCVDDWLMMGIMSLIFLTGLGTFQLELGSLAEKWWHLVMTGLLAGEFIGVLLYITVYRRLGEYQIEQIQIQFREEQREKQKENMMDLYRIGREINHWRHDMSGKMDILYRLQKKGMYEEVEKYFEVIGEELKKYPELPQDTGNEGLNAALIRAIPKCKEEEIRFSYVIMGKPNEIDYMDMGNLIHNLLSNAIEACQKVGKAAYMELVIRVDKKEIEIYLENSVIQSVLKENPNLESRKKDQEQHGFGMETIYSIIKKYGGRYNYRDEGNSFIQEIYLNVDKI